MATVSIDVETSASPPVKVEVPKPAARPAQVLAAALLIAITVVLALLLKDAIDDKQAGAAAVISVLLALPVFVLVVWAAAALGTGVGPRQLIELIKALIDALKGSKDTPEPEPQPGGDPAPADPAPPAGPAA